MQISAESCSRGDLSLAQNSSFGSELDLREHLLAAMVTPAHLCLTTTTAQYLRAIELTPQSQFASELCVSDEQPVIPYHAHTLIMVSQTSNGETFLLETSRASALRQ